MGDRGDSTGRSVLITGGTGLIGRYLTRALQADGYKVAHLSRQPRTRGNINVFSWDPSQGYIDPAALEGIDCIIHLSGANIGEKRWTEPRKREIISSRVESANLLYTTIAERHIRLKAFISASATGYYGSSSSQRIFTEEDPPSDDFLGTTCRLWEEAALQFESTGIRTVRIRTAVVLEKTDSALSRLMAPARFGLVVRTGSGRQYFPWIHIADLCNIYLQAVSDDTMSGAFNAVAPQHISHNDFVRTMARVMKRPVFLPPVPGWLLRAVLGEMSDIVLNGSRISSDKITRSGYRFIFPEAEGALRNILK